MTVSLPNRSRSTTTPSTAQDYTSYFGGLNELTGGDLGRFAKEGTPRLTAEQIQAYGGLGATRTADVNRQRAQAVEGITADPNLTIAQRQRSTQLTDQDSPASMRSTRKPKLALPASPNTTTA
jgi:hypothetical protein